MTEVSVGTCFINLIINKYFDVNFYNVFISQSMKNRML